MSAVAHETETLKNFIGGEWTESAAAERLEIPDPATGEPLASAPLSTDAELDAAVEAAHAAYPAWRATPVPDRAKLLFAYRDVLDRNREDLARSVVLENGKTLAEARGEVHRGIETVEFATAMPTLLQGGVLEQIAKGIDSEEIRQPLGVCVGLCPFNFPAMIPLWMMPIAVGCGNTFVLKPSDRTPRTAVRLAELAGEAGFPPGVLNVVYGGGDAAKRLMRHTHTRAVSFVGSAPVAYDVYTTASEAGKRVQALAGAKNHIIVMPDADMPRTAKAICSSAFGSAGQRCLAGSVLVAVGDAGDDIVAAMKQAAAAMKVGNGMEEDTEIGPLIRPQARERLEGWIEKGIEGGAELVLDGRGVEADGDAFLGPTIFDNVSPEAELAQEELFGPILGVIRVPDLAAGLKLANSSRFGNAAAIFTSSGGAAREFKREIEAGMVGINVGVPAPMAFFPFAGWKGSFYGDLHATGRDGVEFYTERKVVTSRWWDTSGRPQGHWEGGEHDASVVDEELRAGR